MTKMKRALAVGIVLLVSVAFGAFASGAGESKSSSQGSAAGMVKAAFIVSNMANESQAFSAKQFLKFGAQYGFDMYTFDAKGDTQAESQIVTNCIAQKFKVIFLNPNDINAIVPSLIKAKQAGLIVGMFSSDLAPANQQYRDFYAGVNDTMAGQQAAQAFIKHFPNGAKIVEIGGQAGHDAQIKRHDGFNGDKGIKGSNIQVLDYQACQQWSTDQAQTIMENDIVKYGKEIRGVFVHWDNGATGVIQAAKAAGLTGLYIVGVDGNRAGYYQVKSGDQAVSIAQDFVVMTKKDLELAKAVVAGQKVDPINYVPLTVVDKDTIASFDPPEW
ncbi:MAG TPA: sugar ABC transporter substrate-binding protein [Armatimonadota bacterium]|nr:sugar ABC transporter substrate-binding protein [Armatimonadota bacterium]